MTVEVEVAGRVRSVAIDRTDAPGRFRVTVDGVAHLLDVRRTGEHGLSILGTAVPFSTPEGPQKETALLARELHVTPGHARGELFVTLEGRLAPVTVNGRRTGHASEAGAAGHGEVAILAPMPGRVVRVLAAAGEEVAARQAIVVVEAMKMENELRAPRAGRVKEVNVTAGMPVEAGRLLAVIE